LTPAVGNALAAGVLLRAPQGEAYSSTRFLLIDPELYQDLLTVRKESELGQRVMGKGRKGRRRKGK